MDTARILLAVLLAPYLLLSAWDGWMHEKARRVPRAEQALHAVLAVSAGLLIFGVFGGRPGLAAAAALAFIPAALVDELGFHGALARIERRVHHAAYACFGVFLLAAWQTGALRWG